MQIITLPSSSLKRCEVNWVVILDWAIWNGHKEMNDQEPAIWSFHSWIGESVDTDMGRLMVLVVEGDFLSSGVYLLNEVLKQDLLRSKGEWNTV